MRTEEEMLHEILTANNGEGPDPIGSYSGSALTALKAAIHERARLDDLITATVNQAHSEGASWTMIGALLGISRQAAHAKYATVREAGV
jgi:hypothetical protein